MGLIPGYIHTPTGFLDIISRITISFGSIDMENAVLGIMYSLIAVVPLFWANHIIGLVGIFKQSRIIIWVVSTLYILLHEQYVISFTLNLEFIFDEKF